MTATRNHLSIRAARANALFASPLQRSGQPSARQVRRSTAAALGQFGARAAPSGSPRSSATTPNSRRHGCAGRGRPSPGHSANRHRGSPVRGGRASSPQTAPREPQIRRRAQSPARTTHRPRTTVTSTLELGVFAVAAAGVLCAFCCLVEARRIQSADGHHLSDESTKQARPAGGQL